MQSFGTRQQELTVELGHADFGRFRISSFTVIHYRRLIAHVRFDIYFIDTGCKVPSGCGAGCSRSFLTVSKPYKRLLSDPKLKDRSSYPLCDQSAITDNGSRLGFELFPIISASNLQVDRINNGAKIAFGNWIPVFYHSGVFS